MIVAKASAFTARAARSASTAGSRVRSSSIATATCRAAGKVSLLDWLRFTWSFGCTGLLLPSTPPEASIARLAITSLTFMLVWVPEPVCHTLSGNSASRRPEATSSAAATIKAASSGLSLPLAIFTSAQAALSAPKACSTARGMAWPKGKYSIERWVWAPQ